MKTSVWANRSFSLCVVSPYGPRYGSIWSWIMKFEVKLHKMRLCQKVIIRHNVIFFLSIIRGVILLQKSKQTWSNWHAYTSPTTTQSESPRPRSDRSDSVYIEAPQPGLQISSALFPTSFLSPSNHAGIHSVCHTAAIYFDDLLYERQIFFCFISVWLLTWTTAAASYEFSSLKSGRFHIALTCFNVKLHLK